MKFTRHLILALACALYARGSGPADRVVVVANSNAADSVAIARHYAQVRGVPPGNVIAMGMPVTEVVTWREFVAGVWQPLEDELVRRGWIDAIAMDLFDDVGRRKYAISGHRIEALVVCRGVPLKISHDPALYRDFKPYTDHDEFRTNQGAVDSELSLLAETDYPINASIPNPLYRNLHPTGDDLSRVVKVSRLDGPTAADALGLVDLAVRAERTGLLGRAYVDIAGPHEVGDQWLNAVASQITELGFDLSVGHGPRTVPETARFDAPVLYFGWYAQDMNGPFLLPGFRFPPGAIAVHIHSFSASTLRSATEGWCGPLVSRGATATVGNVFEPYLEYTHHLDLLLSALVGGEDLVDAAYYSLPVLSWQSIVVGDPLYRPFAVTLSDQTKDISALPKQLAAYAVIRRMNLLDAVGRKGDAIDAGKAAMKTAPNLALALSLGRLLQASGNKEEAAWTVADAANAAGGSSENWELIREAAVFLGTSGRPAEALDIYRKLFLIEQVPPEMKSHWLVEAREVALSAGEIGQAAEWKDEISRAVEKSLGGKP